MFGTVFTKFMVNFCEEMSDFVYVVCVCLQQNYSTSFRKHIAEHKWLYSRNFSMPYYRQCRVILSADGDGSLQLNILYWVSKIQELILFPGVENGF